MSNYKLQGMLVPAEPDTDQGSHSDMDLTILMPKLDLVDNSWYWVGQQAAPGYIFKSTDASFNQALVVRQMPNSFDNPLAAATGDLHYIWGMKDPQSFELSFAAAPDNYVALSDFFGLNAGANGIWSGSGISRFACVHIDCLLPATIDPKVIWTDHGSHATDDGAVYCINGSQLLPGSVGVSPYRCYAAASDYNNLPSRPKGFWTLDFSKIEMLPYPS